MPASRSGHPSHSHQPEKTTSIPVLAWLASLCGRSGTRPGQGRLQCGQQMPHAAAPLSLQGGVHHKLLLFQKGHTDHSGEGHHTCTVCCV